MCQLLVKPAGVDGCAGGMELYALNTYRLVNLVSIAVIHFNVILGHPSMHRDQYTYVDARQVARQNIN